MIGKRNFLFAAVTAALFMGLQGVNAQELSTADYESFKNNVSADSTVDGDILKFTTDISADSAIGNLDGKSLTIDGDSYSFSGNGNQGFTIGNGQSVTIQNLTGEGLNGFTNNRNGGAISNSGTLSLTNVILSNNKASQGGAVYNAANAEITMENVTFNAANGDALNDIYNAGTITTSGANSFNSAITNTARSEFTFGGDSNTVAGAVTNAGIMNFNGTKDEITGDINNTGTMNFINENIISGAIVNSNNATMDFQGNNTISGTIRNNAGGSISFAGTNTLGGNITNTGTMTLGGTNTINGEIASSNQLDFTGTNTVNNDITGSGRASNSGDLTLNADASGFSGTFTQSAGATTLSKDAVFFGGTSTISGGALNWLGNDLASGARLILNGNTQFNLGNGTDAVTLTLGNGSSVADTVAADIKANSVLNIAGGTLSLNSGDTWAGAVNLSSGTLNYADLTSNGILTTTGGSLNINSGTLGIASGSTIGQNTAVLIKDGSTLDITDGTVSLNTGDTWAGTVNMSDGTLDYSNLTSNGKLTASGGSLNVNSGKLTVASGSSIADAVGLSLAAGSSMDITGGSVAFNSADTDTWSGTINLSAGTLDYGLNSHGIINATGGNLNINSGTMTIDGNDTLSAGVTGVIASGANLVIQKNMTISGNISGQGTVTNDGVALTLTSDNSGLSNYTQTSGSTVLQSGSTIFGATDLQSGSVTFESGSLIGSGTIAASGAGSKSLVINNNTSADAILNALTVSGSNLQLSLNGSDASNDINIDGTNITSLNLSGDQTLSGALTGSGNISKSIGELNLSGDNSGFAGTFTQTGGTTNITGNMLGGSKNINSGNFNVTAGAFDYSDVNIGSGVNYTHTSTAADGGTVDNQISFTGTGATAKFTGTGNTNYTLKNTTASTSNTIAFENSTVKLADSEYNGRYSFTDSTIDLTTETPSNGLYSENYVFSTLTGSNIGLNIDVDFVNNAGTVGVISDTISVNTGNPKFNLSSISIHNDNFAENGGADSYNTQVIKGSGSFASSTVATGASTVYNYTVDVNGQNITLNRGGFTDENSLNILTSQTSGDRFFTFSGSGEETYHIGESLGTALEGKLSITGNGADKSTISGAIVASDGTLTGDNGSLFNIQDNVLDLTISGVTIKDASGTDGAVVNLNNADSTVTIKDSTITGNTVTGNGGAVNIGTNGGKVGIANSTISGNTAGGNGGALNISSAGVVSASNTTFENNGATGNGGAIYNEGELSLVDVTVAAASGSNKNDIYNAATVTTSGTNIFNSDITNADGGTYTFGGASNTVAGAVTNAGIMNFNGTKDEITGDIENSGTMNFVNENIISGAIENADSGDINFKGINEISGDLTNDGAIDFQGKNTISGAIINNTDATIAFAGENTLSNTLTNSGNASFAGTNTLGGNITNTGIMTLGGTNTINGEIDSSKQLDFTGTNTVNNDITGSGTASNSGNLTLNADASGFSGTFTQSEGTTTLSKGADFFGGESTISGGNLLWLGNDISNSAKLTVSGGGANLSLGDGTDSVTLTIQNGSSIAQEVRTVINNNGELVVSDSGNVALNGSGDGADSWLGQVTIHENGTLTMDDFEKGQHGAIVADGGTLNLNTGNLTVAAGSSIADSVKTTIAADTNLYVEGGNVTLSDATDTWDGNIYLNGTTDSTLTINGFDNNGKIITTGGTLNLNNGRLTLENGSEIAVNTVTNLVAGTGLDILEGGTAGIDDNDNWEGDINLDGGTLNYGATHAQDGSLLATTGTLNVLDGAVLQIKIPSVIADAVGVDIQRGSRVEVETGGSLNLDSETNDKWNGVIQIKDGNLKTTELSNTTSGGGGLQQTGGTSEFTQNSHIVINTSDSYINGGNIIITDNSSLTIGSQTQPVVADSIKLETNSLFSSMNAAIENTTADSLIVNGNNGFNIDISPRSHSSDKYIIGDVTSDMVEGGVVKVDKFDFVGLCPIDRNIKLQIFDAQSIADNVTFADSEHSIFTPIGNYHLYSDGGGSYTARLMEYNPQVFRGQVATLAMYNNQLAVEDILLNHVSLQSERFLAQGQNANKYAIVDQRFAPYQYKQEDGGLWVKNYVNFETLSMTHGLNVGNNAYGTIIGADFPVVNLRDGWKFIPTAYIGYNGSNQYFNHVDMYQNGGQGGFMGTFMKRDFIGSILAYGGGYNNEMHVAGHTDTTGNWFAGTAAKLAYNLHATKHFTIQPTAFVSYNIFGKQNWTTDFGIMNMNAGTLNGVNVAPGVNFIYARESWSTYATIQYMYNISEQVGGKAGHVDLPNVRMRHGYLQYGLGVTKTWQDRLNSYFQITFRNGGRTGVGFQLGFHYLFDWLKPFGKVQKVQKDKNLSMKKVIKKLN